MKIFHFLILLFFLPACQSLDTNLKSFFPRFEKKIKAKKSSQSVKDAWIQIERETHLPLEQRIQKLDEFINKYQKEELAMQAYLLKADLFLKKKQRAKACQTYHEASQSLVIYTGSWTLYKKSAQCYLQVGQVKLAFNILQDFSMSSQVTQEEKRKARLFQWSLLNDKKKKSSQKKYLKEKLIVLSALFDLSSKAQEKNKWKRKGIQLLHKLPIEKKLQYEKDKALFTSLAFYLDYELGLYFFKKKDFKKAKAYFKQALSSSSESFKKDIETKLSLIKKTNQVNPSLVGVILPLSGERKALGEKILRGLAAGFNQEGIQDIQMVIMDSKNHPDTVRSHIKELFYKHHVMGLIGGLNSEVAQVIAEKAEEFSTPAIVFSQSQGITKSRRFVFQNAVSPTQLLKPLIQELRETLKIEEVAIMYPDDSYGKKYSSFFENDFKKAGGRITKKQSYKLGEFDFKDEVRALLQLKLKGREKEFEKLKAEFLEKNKKQSGRSKKLTPENILPPIKNFSALFIPDSSVARVRIRDHLKYYGLDSIYLVGLNLWRQEQIKEKDFSILFVYQEEKNKLNSEFYKIFLKNYGQAPGYFEQKAYNTAVFLNQAFRFKPKSRLVLQKRLEQTTKFQGAYNQIQLSEERVFQYPLSLYKKESKKR